MGAAYASVVVHREQPLSPDWLVFEEKNQHPETGRLGNCPHPWLLLWGHFYAPIAQRISQPWAGPECALIATHRSTVKGWADDS